jgi:UDP-N-acetylmuramate dehydrogenase
MTDLYLTLKDRFGERLEQNVVLRDFTGMKVGGVADYFIRVSKIEDLVEVVNYCVGNEIPYFLLGGGWNIVVSDSGFPGLVIKNETNNIVFGADSSEVIVDSGVELSKLINLAAGHDLGGLEFLFGVPGTVGGAIYGNAGAFGHEMGDFVKSVTLLLPKDQKITMVRKTSEWFEFVYRSSILKENYKNTCFRPVVLTAKIQLAHRRKDEILRLIKENIAKKKQSQPLGEKSAGSFFKNPDNQSGVAAGLLLEKAGAKKMRVGGATFSKKHANFLINQKNATADDVRKLAELAKQTVKEKFNVTLEEEIEYVGRW